MFIFFPSNLGSLGPVVRTRPCCWPTARRTSSDHILTAPPVGGGLSNPLLLRLLRPPWPPQGCDWSSQWLSVKQFPPQRSALSPPFYNASTFWTPSADVGAHVCQGPCDALWHEKMILLLLKTCLQGNSEKLEFESVWGLRVDQLVLCEGIKKRAVGEINDTKDVNKWTLIPADSESVMKV